MSATSSRSRATTSTDDSSGSRGTTVFEPMGFDAFGIHSENFALKVGTHPAELIPRNIENFTRQLKRAGADVRLAPRAVDTTDPGLLQVDAVALPPALQARAGVQEERRRSTGARTAKTVLANEQVIAGECERCGTPVEQRFLEQWFFRITEYAQRLLDNLDWIDWSETTKKAQRELDRPERGRRDRLPARPD